MKRNAMRTVGTGSGIQRGRRWDTVRPSNQWERFPDAWKDPLELYGSLRRELTPPDFDSAIERTRVSEFISLHGSQWVWLNRHRLVSLRKLVSRDVSGSVALRADRLGIGGVCDGPAL
jgi:hypothetical protein